MTHWHRLAEGRKTVVFATGVQHSMHLRDEFRRSGVWAEHIDGSTPIDEREEILSNLSAGKVKVVCNCMVLTEGWDQPDVSASCWPGRPSTWASIGRWSAGCCGLRPGKTDALVLDHAGATFITASPRIRCVWTLDEDRRAENPLQSSAGDRATAVADDLPRVFGRPDRGQAVPRLRLAAAR